MIKLYCIKVEIVFRVLVADIAASWVDAGAWNDKI